MNFKKVKFSTVLIFLAIAIMIAVAVNMYSTGSGELPSNFESSWAIAVEKATAANKPIYAHFTTSWCTWCRKMEQDTYASEEGQVSLSNFVAVSLDCTVAWGEEPEGETKINIDLFRQVGGSGYPYIVIFTPDGKTVLHTISGYVKPEQFVKEAKFALLAMKNSEQ